MIKQTFLNSHVNHLLLKAVAIIAATALLLATVAVGGGSVANAHLGSIESCQASNVSSSSMKYATWGCGEAGPHPTDRPWMFAIASFDDRRHDHSCVSLGAIVNGSWQYGLASSCGSPTTSSLRHGTITKVRIFRNSGGFMTLWTR